MATTREKIAGEAQVGAVKFWATRATPQPTPRRIVQYGGVGVNGATTDDLGKDARTEILNATVDEDIYVDLDEIKDSADVVTCVHPLFGVFQGRLVDVTYDAGPDDMVDIVCTLIEHGDPANLFILNVTSTAAKKQSADSVFNDMSGDLDDLDDFPSDSGLPSAATGLSDGFSDFSAVMTAAQSGDALWAEAANAYTGLAEAGNVLIDAIDAVEDATDEMIGLVDSTYELIAEARGFVDAMEKQVSQVWQDFQVVNPLSLAEIALEFMGDASDEAIDTLLDRNPNLIDICAVPVGVSLSIPVPV